MPKFQLLQRLTKSTAKKVILFTLSLLLTITPTTFAKQPENLPFLNQAQTIKSATSNPEQLLEQGEAQYLAGNLQQAIAILQQAASIYQQENNNLGEAAALTNLSLVYQQLGTWKEADIAINSSLKLLGWHNDKNLDQKLDQKLNIDAPNQESWEIIAQTLDIWAVLMLKQGKTDASLEISQQASQIWQQLDNKTAIIRSRINQAQALRASGFYRRSLSILKEISNAIYTQPDSLVKVTALRSLGNTHQQLGNLEESDKVLKQSLKIAQRLKLSQEIALTELSLGNNFRSLGNTNKAINRYQKAAQAASNSLTKIQAQINQLSLLVENKQTKSAEKLIPIIQPQLGNLSVNQNSIYARINFARTLTKTKIGNKQNNIAEILATSFQQAKTIGNERAQSYALGTLGELYEQNQQYPEAKDLTQKALFLAQKNDASDIAYLWEWQLGRLLKANGNIRAAISAYDSAVATLDSLRSDLAAVNREVQFNFRDSVEPIYRQSVELLLQKGEVKPDLDKARQRIEALQLAELDNYFREACLNNEFVVLDKVVDSDNPDTAIFYPIILDNQLEIILKLPQRELIHRTSEVSKQELEQLMEEIRRNIVQPDGMQKFQTASKRLYELLIKPVEIELKNSPVGTLVFIPDSLLRNIPMAALYDGKEYLVKKYAIAISPGLQLFTPKSLTGQKLNALAGGLSEIPEGENFAPLPNVSQELTSIEKSGVSTVKLYNERFTSNVLKEKINAQPFQVIHLATHGQFSSNPNKTFLLASDKRIQVAELDRLIKSRRQQRAEPIELLVLSACETAAGDNRAALGLAGIALSAGARSTLASLWQIGDDSTAYFMDEFYSQLVNGKSTAEALQQAQLKLLDAPEYNRPMYWAPYVLVGNWL
ncbi:MAG: CHAT domain-containing protein [Cyanobacteria bacterium J06633_8]